MGEVRIRENVSATATETLVLNQVKELNTSSYTPGVITTTSTWYESNNVLSDISTVMTDIVTPNYRKLSAQGYIINNPMEKTTYYENSPEVKVNYQTSARKAAVTQPNDGKIYEKVSGVLALSGKATVDFLSYGSPVAGYLPVVVDSYDTAVDKAVSQAWRNISHSDILMLAAVAESGKTVTGLVNIFRAVYRLIKAVTRKVNAKKFSARVKGVGRDAVSIYNEIEDLYMNARYGLRPLYYDIIGIMDLFEKAPKHDRYTFRGISTNEQEVSDSYDYYHSNFPGYGGSSLKFTHKRVSRVVTAAYAGVLTKLDDLTIWKRMGIDAIPETMWELVPFSFVVDWFFNVGNTLLAWAPKYGSSILSSWVTVEQTVTQQQIITVEPTSLPKPNPFVFGSMYGLIDVCEFPNAIKTKTTVLRKRIISPTRPILPSLDVKLDNLKLLDLGIICKNLLTLKGNVPFRSA